MKLRIICLTMFALCAGAQAGEADVKRVPIPGQSAIVVAAQNPPVHPVLADSVVVITALENGGHLGIVVNKPTEVKMSDLFPRDEAARNVDNPVYFGGPVAKHMVTVIINADQAPQGASIALGDSLHLVLEEQAIDEIIRTRPNDAHFYVGLITWPSGLLAEQVREDAWRVTEMSPGQAMSNGPSGHSSGAPSHPRLTGMQAMLPADLAVFSH